MASVSGVPYILNLPPVAPGVKSENKPDGKLPETIVTFVISAEESNSTSSSSEFWQASMET